MDSAVLRTCQWGSSRGRLKRKKGEQPQLQGADSKNVDRKESKAKG